MKKRNISHAAAIVSVLLLATNEIGDQRCVRKSRHCPAMNLNG